MATIQIRIDESTKSAAENLFGSLGLDTSTAVRMFISAALEYNGIPFAMKRQKDIKPNAEFREAMEDRLPSNITFASEKVLAKDWLLPEEDEAWANL